MMEFKQIEAFVNVVKYKSFSKGADACFLTQPTISAHISTLENELGVKLLNRCGRETIPTNEGKIFYKYAIQMLNTREKAVLSVDRHAKDIQGILDIQASAVPGQYILPGLMAEFNQVHPNVKFNIQQSDSEEVSKNMTQGRGEIGFTGSIDDNTLVYSALTKDELVFIAPANNFFNQFQEDEIDPKRLGDVPMILREQGSGTRKEFEKYISVAKLHKKGLNVVARINSIEGVKKAVCSGLGAAIVSELAIEDIRDCKSVRVFRIKGIKMNRMLYIVYNKNLTLSPAAEAFKAFAEEKYSGKVKD